MAICPFAKQEIIPPGSNDPHINARLAILHVAVSMAPSIRSIFLGRSGIESHFYINWRGRIIQYRDTGREADANLGANDIAVSIETAGWGSGKWNARQRRSIQRLLLWLNNVEDIPLRKATGARGSGVGYHVQFGAPGGWTTVAKSCPGPARIRQYHNWLVPWMNARHARPTATVSDKEFDDMDQETFNRYMRGFYDSEKWDAYDDKKNRKISHLFLRTDMWTRRNAKRLRSIENKVDRLLGN